MYVCFKEFGTIAQLKAHISLEHKVLESSGIEIDAAGQISYPDHIIERALLTTYMFGTMVHEKVLKCGKKLEAELAAVGNGEVKNGEGQVE